MRTLLLALLVSFPLSSWAQPDAPAPVTITSSDLPIIVIDTHQQTILDDPKITADIRIIDNGPGVRNVLADPATSYSGQIGIELRGSSSQWFYAKKSFGFETRDSQGEDLDVPLLGMPAGSDWVLSASFGDKTMMRNVLTYNIAREAGSYASRTRYCEVIVNGVYQGIYIFAEKIKRGADRVNISKLKTSDKTGDAVTGGYILKLDKTTGTPAASWTSKYKNPANPLENDILFQVEYPKQEDLNPEQLGYIQAYVDSFETALSTKPFADARTGYRHYINTKSFIDFFLISELSRNVDGYCYSTYFYKDRTSKGGKLTMGPVWDYDIAWANANYCDGSSATGWVYNNIACGQHIPFWWRQLLADPAFAHELSLRWAELRGSVLAQAHLDAQLDANASQLAESRQRYFQAWPILGTYVWPNVVYFNTYPEEVNYLKEWIHRRLAWMDENLLLDSNAVTSSKDPLAFTSAGAYPVPFTTDLTVEYALPQASAVRVAVLDVLGQQVAEQSLPLQSAGPHTLSLPAGAALLPGVYYVQLTSSAGTRTLRVVRAAN